MSIQDAFSKVGKLKKKRAFPVLRVYADGGTLNPGSLYILGARRWHAPELYDPEVAAVASLQAGAHLDHLRNLSRRNTGQTRMPHLTQAVVDPVFSARVGAAYDALPEWIADALPAYQALNDEVTAQADLLEKYGYSFSLYGRDGEPYASSTELRSELHGSKHLTLFTPAILSIGGFFQHHYRLEHGVNVPLVHQPNPLLQWDARRSTPERPVLKIDLLRFVHAAFGHGIHPHPFGPLGEDNAYREHLIMFSPLAQQALTTETRGQISWVNFGRHLQRPDGSFPEHGDPDFVQTAHRIPAVQKIALLPEWAADPTTGNHTDSVSSRWGLSADGDLHTPHRARQQTRPRLIVDDGYADIAYKYPRPTNGRKPLAKLPGDSVSYFRRNEKGGFWHDGAIWSYDRVAGGFNWVRDLSEEELSQDEQNALNKRRRYFGIPAP